MLGTPSRADPVIRSLIRKRWLERIAAGRYLLIPADRGPKGIPDSNLLGLVKHLAESYYVGYATAAAHYRFTTQARSTLWIVTPRHVADRTVRGVLFRFVNVVPRKFFGCASVRVLGREIVMSDREKTVLDCVDKIDNAGGIAEVARIISRATPKIEWPRFCDYARRLGSVAAVQRFGYLADRVSTQMTREARAGLQAQIKKHSRSYLGPTARWGKQATYDAEWRILVNVPQREITAEV